MYLHPLMANVPPTERAALIECSELRSYRRSDNVLAAQEWTGSIYFVTNGLLRVVEHGSGPDGDATTDFIHRNDFFLGATLQEDRHRATQTLVAALPSSVYLIPIPAMRRLCEAHPDVAMALFEMAARRIRMLRGQLQKVSSLSSEDLVARVLHQLTQLAPASTGGFDKRITQAVIASYSGLSRELVNKIMRDLESRGLVWRDGQGIHVGAQFASTHIGGLQESVPDAGERQRALKKEG